MSGAVQPSETLQESLASDSIGNKHTFIFQNVPMPSNSIRLSVKVSPAPLHSNAPKKIHKLPCTLPIVL